MDEQELRMLLLPLVNEYGTPLTARRTEQHVRLLLSKPNLDPTDVEEGVMRCLHDEAIGSYPKFGKLWRKICDARSDRLRGPDSDQNALSDGLRRYTDADREELVVWKALAGLGVHHCEKEGWRVGGPCSCPYSLTSGVSCYGRNVPLSEAREKLAVMRGAN